MESTEAIKAQAVVEAELLTTVYCDVVTVTCAAARFVLRHADALVLLMNY